MYRYLKLLVKHKILFEMNLINCRLPDPDSDPEGQILNQLHTYLAIFAYFHHITIVHVKTISPLCIRPFSPYRPDLSEVRNDELRTSSIQNSPHSLPPTSCAMASSTRSLYRLRYSCFTCSRCRGSQCSRTRREMSSSDRSRPDRDSRIAWCRSSASRMGRLMTPLRMCARVSP